MAISAVDIANGALIKLGTSAITSLNDDTVDANRCRIRLPVCRKFLLRMHDWNAAMKRVTLSPTTTTPAFGFGYAFNLPADFLRLIQVDDRATPYRKEGNQIVCDSTSLEIRYLRDTGDDDYSMHAADFCECLSAYLAYDLAYAITQSLELKNDMRNDFLSLARKARFIDSTEHSLETVISDTFDGARFGGSLVLPLDQLP